MIVTNYHYLILEDFNIVGKQRNLVAHQFRVLRVASSNLVFPTILKIYMKNWFIREKEMFDKRIHEIDLFRGFLIILVIFDHLLWFINFYITHHQSAFLNWYWTSDLRNAVRQIVLLAFLFTCGVSCYFSRNNKRRGFLLLILCILITVVTHVAQLLPMFNNRVVAIDFNILVIKY